MNGCFELIVYLFIDLSISVFNYGDDIVPTLIDIIQSRTFKRK